MRLKTILAALAAVMVPQGAMAQTVQPDAPAAVKAVGIGLPNQIIRSSPTTTAEDEDLAKALSSFKSAATAGRKDDFSALTGYLERHPMSGWSTSLQVNIGDMQMDRGFFTRALASWEAAWRLGSASTDRDTKLLVDHALAMAAKTRATFGQYDQAATMLSAARDRKIAGSATEQIQIVSDTLGQIKTNPKHVSVCGPQALQLLLRIRNPKEEVFDLHGYEAGLDGTTLAELSKLATKHNMPHRLVKWLPGQPIPTSGVVHWKAGHFAALLGHDGNDLIIADSAYPQGLRMSPVAFAEEASGYMLVPNGEKERNSLASIPTNMAEIVRGKGPVQQMETNGIGDFLSGKGDREGCPLCGSNIKEGSLAIAIQDTPVGYAPATGPSIFTTVFYDQRTAWQTATMPYANLGQKWSLSWTRYIDQGNYTPGGSVKRVTGAGTEYTHYGYNSSTGQFTPQYDDGSVLRIVSTTPLVYERTTGDGTVETYSTDTGGNPYRRIYLTSIKDPQGNTITLGYQNFVLKTITDAYGRVTTITTDGNNQITRIEDPFGRAAIFTYDFDKRLTSITDILGLKSSLSYDVNSLVNALTTPYGTTTYRYTPPGTATAPRFAEIEDPLGNRMRNEWVDDVTPGVAPANTVPTGMPLPAKADYLQYRNTFHWSKDAYVAAGCTSTGGCDYSKARITHFEHANTLNTIKALGVESVKQPLENRVFLQYPNQATNTEIGSYFTPSAAARVVAGGATQINSTLYDQAGYYKPLRITDAAGRITDYQYSTNRIDLLSVKRMVGGGIQQTLMQTTYDANHNPLTITDAAGQTTTYTYNARGQIATAQDAVGNMITYAYDSLGRTSTITNANNVVAATYTYDGFDRLATETDSQGWTATYQYDAANRRIRTTYPDGTFETYAYDKLDLVRMIDRTGRIWRYSHDANSQVTKAVDPMGNTTAFEYTPMGNLAALIDAKGNRTNWAYDVQGRLVQKRYADNMVETYAYDPASGNLASRTDALGQVKQYGYTVDDQLASLTYVNSVHPTAPGRPPIPIIQREASAHCVSRARLIP
jgi:YD repeat-containing protein